MSITQLVTSGPLILALPVAAAAGAVTFLSPCCLPLVPGYLSFVTGMAGAGGPSSPAVPASAPAAAAAAGASGVAVAAPPQAAPPQAATAAVPPRGRV
ncbi:MAG TPA: cytochrome c biogenesis protein CcdA, partial [Streptosporangiaceae bacterium]|nr:cytochrome c biogenesis protein CcdA [Streptosporangiaceae bacterium]